ncbi:protein-tyrosine phosphatase-like protein [Powellomyces hirtus]|nr:protein-tyrosine phosphatase-like protein [Powellomyces hirtus]
MNRLDHDDRIDAHDWIYEMRRDMQEILPGLWLGPYHCSKDKEALKVKGITHMLCIRDPNERNWVKTLYPDEFVYHVIEVTESPLQNLIPYFAGCREFIDQAFASGGRVFVHCSSGISRSPCFVVAYIMMSKNWEFQKAYSFVQNRRFCMNPNEGFKYQLKVSSARLLTITISTWI